MNHTQARIKLIVSIFGDEFNPIDFTKLIEIEPSEFWKKGENIPNRNGLVRKESSWDYAIGFIETVSFDEISEAFINVFQSKIEKINIFTATNNLDVKLFVIVELGDNEAPALFLNTQFLDAVHKLNAEIDIDLYK